LLLEVVLEGIPFVLDAFVRGLAGAYVADLCLLGRCKEGWEKLRAATP